MEEKGLNCGRDDLLRCRIVPLIAVVLGLYLLVSLIGFLALNRVIDDKLRVLEQDTCKVLANHKKAIETILQDIDKLKEDIQDIGGIDNQNLVH